jgi:hypothetical protein
MDSELVAQMPLVVIKKNVAGKRRSLGNFARSMVVYFSFLIDAPGVAL